MRRAQTWHEQFIPELAELMEAGTYLELGTYDGTTIRKVRDRVPSCRCIGVDSKFGLDLPGVESFLMTTTQFIQSKAAAMAPFDLVFIDADHSAKAAWADFNGIYDMVRAEGLILLHDTNPETVADTQPGYCGDSWRLNRLLHGNGYEYVCLPYHPGLTIVRKRVQWGPGDG